MKTSKDGKCAVPLSELVEDSRLVRVSREVAVMMAG